MVEDDGAMLTTAEAMRELRISRATLYNWIERKRIEPVRAEHLRRPRLRFRRSDIDRLKAEDKAAE